MMKTKRPLSLILASLMLATCLLPTAGCKKQASEPENPFDDLASEPSQSGDKTPDQENNDGGIIPDRFFGASDYDATAAHGEQKLYRDESDTMWRSLVNGMAIEWNDPNVMTYDINNPSERSYLCFDPTCEHVYVESCTSSLHSFGYADPNNPDAEEQYYSVQMVVDCYDRARSPVVYMSFRREPYYFVNGVMFEREMVSCIERFDMETGKRTVVADYIEEIIDGTATYGDYVYFTTVDAEDNRSICRVHKSGGEIERLGMSEKGAVELLDAVDGKLYYLIGERYLNRCDLELNSGEQIMDMNGLMTDEGYGSLYSGTSGGYLYYRADIEMVSGSFTPDSAPAELGSRCNMYRLPLNDPTAAPELVAENMISYNFGMTDDTLFYCPAVYEIVDVTSTLTTYMYPVNECNGTIYALDLNTLEQTTVCENTGLVFNGPYTRTFSGEDDCITFSANPYANEGIKLSNNGKNTLIGKKSGGIEVWGK